MGLKVEAEYQTKDGPQSLPNKSSLERDWRDNRKNVISLWVLEMLSEFILSLSLANSRVIKISAYYIYNGKNVHIPAIGYFFEKKVCSQSLECHMVLFQSIFNISQVIKLSLFYRQVSSIHHNIKKLFLLFVLHFPLLTSSSGL